MSTEESKKVDKEVSLTRRAALKAAGWAVPVTIAVGLGGNAFVHATGGSQTGRTGGGGGRSRTRNRF